MNKVKTLIKKNKLAITFWLGVILLTVGIGLWLYTDQTIKNHERILQTENLPIEEKWRYEGSLEWWKKASLTTYRPTAIALLTIGTCLMETALIFLVAQPKPKPKRR